jgi:hypothetical protein
MILARGEYLIRQDGANLVYGVNITPGVLSLSNFRIVFEAGAGGPSPFTAYQEGIDGVWNVHAGQTSKFLEGRREFLTIEGMRGRFIFEVSGAGAWAQGIVRAKANIPPPSPPPPREPVLPPPPGYGGQGPVVVNVQAPAAPTVMMHCRNCGNLYDATKGRCDKCGAPPA